MSGQGAPGRRERGPWYAAAAAAALLFVLWGFRAFLATSEWGGAQGALSESLVLFSLTSVNIVLIGTLLFVLFRNLLKVWIERRRGLIGARFRSQLVGAFLVVALVPSLGLFWMVRELMGKSIESLFNPPLERLMTGAFHVAEAHHARLREQVMTEAGALAAGLDAAALQHPETLGPRLRAALRPGMKIRLSVFDASGRLLAADGVLEGGDASAAPLPPLPQEMEKLRLGETLGQWEPPGSGRVEGLAPVLAPGGGLAGIVSAEFRVAEDLQAQAAELGSYYELYKQFNLRKRTIKHSRIWAYGTVYLLVIFGAAWAGMTVAKAITRPVEALLAGTRALSEGRLDHRVEVESGGDFGALVQSFNRMTEDLARANRELDSRRRHIESVLETIPAGVLTLNMEGRVDSVNRSARAILGLGEGEAARGSAAEPLMRRPGAEEIWKAFEEYRAAPASPFRREILLSGDKGSHQVMLDIVTPHDEEGRALAWVLVLDDLTELSRTQKIAAWQDVAQRLAREIKNPLTPVQLTAQRILQEYNPAAPAYRTLVKECVEEIVRELQSLKVLVDEFTRFARMPAPVLAPVNTAECVDAAVALYEGHYEELSIRKDVAPGLPPVKADAEQIKRVLANLLENAIEASGRKGEIIVEAAYDAARRVLRLAVRDQGRGVPPEMKDRLFLPYFSTKVRGMGLGLAIVNRIVTDHGGRVLVEDNAPKGSVFIVELPG